MSNISENIINENTINSIPEDTDIKSKIVFIKSKKEKNNDDFTVDAINHYISNLDSCKKLKFVNYFYIDNENEFMVTDKIYCKAQKLIVEDKENISYTLELYSYELKLKNLKEFVEELKEKYYIEQNNKLGNKKFYFDEHHVSLMRNQDNSIKFSTAPNELSFKMTQFKTNKSLKNVFGNHLNVVKERVDLFCNHPEWYEEKGIPYTLGILLHGPPGSGKTSLIKALAGDTKRHIFNIKLSTDTTRTQLNNLFFNERVKVLNNGETEIYNIALDNRIYVMEDIDCDNDLLLDRKYRETEETQKENNYNNYEHSFEYNYSQINPEMYNNNYCSINEIDIGLNSLTGNNFNNIDGRNSNDKNNFQKKNIVPIEEDKSEQVTLSFILNLLDGILETPGRILIMTSNYPDKLDKALIRPGRIDINLKVGYCNIIMISEMFTFFYKNENISSDKYNFIGIDIKNDITPAQLNQILLNNFNNPEIAYEEIVTFINLIPNSS